MDGEGKGMLIDSLDENRQGSEYGESVYCIHMIFIFNIQIVDHHCYAFLFF